ncbi:hypothetical protein ZHAS_00004509 [Anopheles sinensis]|uniref:Uncharacterized protein n=1 Tax=Anopheles sinensis TaxID=74873 RepID=A0A084VH48_ANOSI|nr:hypothetical protein ZHAS_00004509 [Anopheles sinensis]
MTEAFGLDKRMTMICDINFLPVATRQHSGRQSSANIVLHPSDGQFRWESLVDVAGGDRWVNGSNVSPGPFAGVADGR